MHRRRAALAVSAVLLLSTAPSVRADAPGTPRLRLRAASPSVELLRYGSRNPVWLDLSVFLVSLDAPFELHIRRETYDDPIRIWQAFHRPSGLQLEELPAEILESWFGLRRFLRIELFDRSGTTLLRRRIVQACPSGWQVERIDSSGPFDPTYPDGCGAGPLALGAVWGIDQGWGAVPSTSNASVRIRDGRYVARVTIMPEYQQLFGVAAADASVEVAVRIRTSAGCDFCEEAPDALDTTARRALTPAPVTGDPDPDTVADLVALPPFGIGTSSRRGRDYLHFGANVWNRGPASLVVEGFRAAGEDRMDAYQYFLRDGEIVGRAPVGSFEFDHRDGHQHWHFLQFARYRLLDASQTHAVRSRKQSFCLAPTDGIDLTVPGAVWRPYDTGFSQCGWLNSIWIREVLPTGWGDTYIQSVPGQSFDITNLPNGSYWIEVQANPLGLLFDANPANDSELREVILGGRPGGRWVSVPPWHGIDTESWYGGF